MLDCGFSVGNFNGWRKSVLQIAATATLRAWDDPESSYRSSALAKAVAPAVAAAFRSTRRPPGWVDGTLTTPPSCGLGPPSPIAPLPLAPLTLEPPPPALHALSGCCDVLPGACREEVPPAGWAGKSALGRTTSPGCGWWRAASGRQPPAHSPALGRDEERDGRFPFNDAPSTG